MLFVSCCSLCSVCLCLWFVNMRVLLLVLFYCFVCLCVLFVGCSVVVVLVCVCC